MKYCDVKKYAEKVRDWCANPPWLPDLDEQQLTLDGTVLTLTNGGTVDLAAFLDNTDDQQITDFSLAGSILTITLEDGGTEDVDLAGLIPVEEEVIEITCAQAISTSASTTKSRTTTVARSALRRSSLTLSRRTMFRGTLRCKRRSMTLRGMDDGTRTRAGSSICTTTVATTSSPTVATRSNGSRGGTLW